MIVAMNKKGYTESFLITITLAHDPAWIIPYHSTSLYYSFSLFQYIYPVNHHMYEIALS